MNRHENDEFDFEYIGGKKVLKDGRVLRVRQTMMDAAPDQRLTKVLRDYRQQVTDGLTNDSLVLHKPGFRAFRTTNDAMRDELEDRELDRLGYLAGKDEELRTSEAWFGNPPAGQGSHDLPSEPEEGVACTINGYPGVWRRTKAKATFRPGYESRMVCVPVGRPVDSLNAYDLYDLEIADAWRGGGPKPPAPDDDPDDDEDDDAQDPFMEGAVEQAVYGTSTHTESQLRGDALRLDTLGKLRQHNTNMEKVYDAYDKQLAEAYRK